MGLPWASGLHTRGVESKRAGRIDKEFGHYVKQSHSFLMGIAALNPSSKSTDTSRPCRSGHGRDAFAFTLCFCCSPCPPQIVQTTRSRIPSEWRCCAEGRLAWMPNEERWAGPPRSGMAHRDDPRNSAGAREVERSETRMPGALSLWLLSLSRGKEKRSEAE